MKRSYLKKNPEKIREWINRSRKPLPKMGPRGKKRKDMNRELDKKLRALGIDECEIRIPGVCVRHIMLHHAHALKSRFIQTDEDWLRAALCCDPCHDKIEALPHAEMARLVDEAIARREQKE